MTDTLYWDKRNKQILSRVGYWQGGKEVIIEGHSLLTELMGHCSLMQVNILNATGRLVAKNVADWIEVNFMGVSYPDSRIWCNQISAYAADTNTSVVAAASAAILSADSRAYGGSQTTQSCMTFLQSAFSRHQQGESLHDIVSDVRQVKGKPIITGFARPIDRDDERLAPYIALQKSLAIEQGQYVKFALMLSEFLDQQFALSINSGGYSSAFLLDQGFSPAEGYKIKAFAVIGGAVACYRDNEKSSPNSFLPQRCDDIEYTGVAPRPLP